MFSLGELILLVSIAYFVITRITPQILRWIILRWYRIEARIGRIGVPYLTLHDVHLSAKGFTIEMDHIGFRSSFLSSEVTKLVSVVIHDVRINKDMVSGGPGFEVPNSLDHLKIPPLLITVAQFVSVRIEGVTMAVVGGECVVHTTMNSVMLEASVVHNARSLLLTISLGTATTRLLRQGVPHPSLANISASITLDSTIIATTPLSLQNISLSFSNIKTVINEGIYVDSHMVWMKTKIKTEGSNKLETFDYNKFLEYISPLVPKKLAVRFDDCVFTDHLERDVTTLKKLYFDSTFTYLPHKACGLKANATAQALIFGLNVKSYTDSLLTLTSLSLDSSLIEKRFSTKLTVESLSYVLEPKKLKWISTIYSSSKTTGDENSGLSRWLPPELEIEVRLMVSDVSATVLPDIANATIGLSRLKISYDSHPPVNEDVYEILIESLWWRTHATAGWTAASLRREHWWGSSLFLGLVLVKGSSARIDALADIVRVEWSPPLAAVILSTLVQNIPSLPKAIEQKKRKNKPSDLKIAISLSITSINLFFIADKKVCLMGRVDSIKMDTESWPQKVTFLADGTKVSSICPTSTSFVCNKSADVKHWCGYIEGIRMELRRSHKHIRLKLSKHVNIIWSPNLHLKFRQVILQISQFIQHFKYKVYGNLRTSNNSSAGLSKSDSIIQISLSGHIKFVAKLSQQHNITLFTDSFNLSSSPAECIWSTSMVTVTIDSADTMFVEALHFVTLNDSDLVKHERANSEGFILPWNRTWSISMQSVKIVFPYEHDFCVVVQDELVSIFKWLKTLHGSNKESRLPPDLLIKVKEFLFEISDDPFEVRLRDNYELLVDEYKESLMRQKKLDQKVAEMCKTHLLIPSGKLNELYANLSKVNAQIYVQRSIQIKAAGTRTRLLAWIVNDVVFLAMADPSLHGKENAIANMKQIDPTSPWPEEGLEFSTLWCRSVVAKCDELKFQLRDFPQPWVDIGQLNLWGRLVGAEQTPSRRGKRVMKIDLGDPWGEQEVERSMTSLKFYHDFNMEVDHFSYAFGPCWEPVIAQCNLSFEKIVHGSADPSLPLPLWDRLRLVLHGRLTSAIKQMTVLLHASLDPYNTTEEMEITWSSLALDWTNAKIIFKGDLDIYVRTASKYDDCRLLHLPQLKLTVKLSWDCLGDPNDHHSVMPCAPDKLPDYSSNQEHDSFRAFRSQSLNVSLALETKPTAQPDVDFPVALLYGSTLRWFENLKLILSGVTRPTRRGPVFQPTPRPRKIPLSRHYKKLHLLLSLHTFQLHYWMSFAMQRGFELTADSISFSSEHLLSLLPINDGLVHRSKSEWSVVYMTCELQNAEIWLRSALPQQQAVSSLRAPVEKCYFLSVGKVSYGREGSGQQTPTQPTHRLVVYGLKAAWTMSNRDVVFALYDTFMRFRQMKKNLSVDALKGFWGEGTGNSRNKGNRSTDSATGTALTPNASSANTSGTVPQASPMSKLEGGHGATMLQQLIAEVDTKSVVFSDEPTTEPGEQPLLGLAACQHTDDVAYNNWSITLVNSQVLLKGPETRGYVIISAAKAEIVQRVHRPVWVDMTLVVKTTWDGSLQSVQYYATVNADQANSLDENIMWLNVDNIKEKDDCIIAGLPDVPQLVGSGQSVGGVVSETVGASSDDTNHSPLQLQRIVSRCSCEFFYASFGESSMEDIPATSCEDSNPPWEPPRPQPIEAFTLMHHDLDVCTNSLQYAMLLDIVNNLLLYVDVERKERYERLQRMRFQHQLQSVEDQRRPILEAQTRLRSLMSQVRSLEKEMYLVQRALQDEPTSAHLAGQIDSLERQVNECKQAISVASEELGMRLCCLKETQLMVDRKLAAQKGDESRMTVVRANEICFKHAQWRLTEADGQLGIADLQLSNFLYTKNSKSDDSVEHLLEIGYVKMTNLLPNQIYREVLQPTEILNNMPVDRKRAVRVFCRERAPVGGISVMEHFEINVVPLTIELTKKFYNTMLKFCFPGREGDDTEMSDDSDKRGKALRSGKETNFYVPIERKEDVEKMKERAEKNKLFIYIKIPEVPVKVSYKGNKEKNLSDLRDSSLVIPTLEYHNVTWTWLDLLLAMKSDSKSVIVSQAIKHKLQIKSIRQRGHDEGFPLDEDKAKILFGTRHMPGENKSNIKKGFFKFPK